jgi:RecA-family ATPase
MKDMNDLHQAGVDLRAYGDSAKLYRPETFNKRSETWREHCITADNLQTKSFPPVVYIVPGIVATGLSILAGRPKIGKSWMVLEMCLGIAEGTQVLGNIVPIMGDVLYCALEDPQRRLQSRISKLLWPRMKGWPKRLTLATRWRRLDEGGAEDIAQWINSADEPRAVVLDTLAGVRPERSRNDTTYDGDYRALVDIQRLANDKGVGAIALHHTRRMEADDPLDTISGTLGQVGCADTGIVLNRGPQGSTLYVRGRDLEEAEHAILFNKETCRWTILGDAADVQRSDTRKKIMAELLKAKSPMKPVDIAHATGIALNTIYQRLPGMVEAGEAAQVSRGLYCHPNALSNTPSGS